jgi:PiT family inorganic phosphate transporter
VSFILVQAGQRLIFDKQHPEVQARRYVPVYIFLTAFVIALVTLLKGLKHIGLELTATEAVIYAVAFSLVIMAGGIVMVRRIHSSPEALSGADQQIKVERTFGILMIVTACAMAFAHGSNDVANAIGPVAAVVTIIQTGEVTQTAAVSPYILLIGAVGIVIGLATYGYRVMATVGRNITELTPSRGFAATLAAASTVVLASGTGLPVSTSHTLVGAVLGVGLARGIGALNLGVIRTIFMSWIITLPVGAALSVLFYYILRATLT